MTADRPVIREPGQYAVVDGAEHHVVIIGREYVRVARPGGVGLVQHAVADLDDLFSVAIFATWRGGRIVLGSVAGDECGFYTDDRRLVEAEGLPGNPYDGWRGVAPLAELNDVEERVRSVHPRNRPRS